MVKKAKIKKVRKQRNALRKKKKKASIDKELREVQSSLETMERLQANLDVFQQTASSTKSMLSDVQELLSDPEVQYLLRRFRALPEDSKKRVAQLTWKLYQERKLH